MGEWVGVQKVEVGGFAVFRGDSSEEIGTPFYEVFFDG